MITADQVTALAPDVASFKAGKALANERKWTSLGRNETALWGLAQGSGKNPYQTQVIVGDLAYKCSCPSRKFPCKHALGLLFLAAADLEKFPQGELPAWVKDWHASRRERQAKAENRSKQESSKPKDEAAASKRKAKRSERVLEGIDFFESFIVDLAQNGLGQESVSDPSTWEDVSKRLIDCQVPGLAGYARRLGEIPHSGIDWEHRLLLECGSLYLLLRTYRDRERRSPELRAEVEQLIGWPAENESVLANGGVEDDWFVSHRILSENDRLVTSATWLYGRATHRWGLLLNFAALPSRPLDPWPIGSNVKTELAFYPGVAPDRVQPVHPGATATLTNTIPEAPDTFTTFLQGSAQSLAINPWRTRFPFLLRGQPGTFKGRAVIIDQEGQALPWKPFDKCEQVLRSVSAGHPITLAGEWDGHQLQVHAAADGSSWFSLRSHAA